MVTKVLFGMAIRLKTQSQKMVKNLIYANLETTSVSASSKWRRKRLLNSKHKRNLLKIKILLGRKMPIKTSCHRREQESLKTFWELLCSPMEYVLVSLNPLTLAWSNLIVSHLICIIYIGNTKYHVIIGSNGPCKLAVNVGGKIFRAPHEVMNRGLIDVNQVKLLGKVV